MAALALVLLAGCSVEVRGAPGAAPVRAAAAAPAGAPGTAGRPGPRSGLDADPISDECLLDASELGALVGTAVRPPEESTVARPDGSVGRSCVASSGADPVAMVNVYRTRTGTPADYVRAGAQRHDLAGVGEAAAVFPTGAGPTLQVAAPAYLVTILVARGTPGDDAWRAAAAAALSRLPR